MPPKPLRELKEVNKPMDLEELRQAIELVPVQKIVDQTRETSTVFAVAKPFANQSMFPATKETQEPKCPGQRCAQELQLSLASAYHQASAHLVHEKGDGRPQWHFYSVPVWGSFGRHLIGAVDVLIHECSPELRQGAWGKTKLNHADIRLGLQSKGDKKSNPETEEKKRALRILTLTPFELADFWLDGCYRVHEGVDVEVLVLLIGDVDETKANL